MLWGRWMVRWQSAIQEEKRTAVRKKKESRLCMPKQNFLYEGKDVLILAVGNMVSKACAVRKKLAVQRDSSNDCQYAFCEAV